MPAFTDVRFSVNHQAGNDFRLAADDVLIDGNGKVFPVLDSVNGSAWAAVWPVFGLDRVKKTDFESNSFFVNDRWQLGDKWAFNLGARFDENDGRDAGGALVTDDRKVSPRLGLSYDLEGDGNLVFNASYGTYVAAISNSLADSTSTGGAIGRAILFYGGPPINVDPSCLAAGTCIDTPRATEIVMNWWLETTGFNPLTDPPENIAAIPGVQFLLIPGTESNVVVRDTIKSPSVDEFTVGVTKRLGNKGVVRADVVYRDWTDFYANRTTLETGTVVIGGNRFDLQDVGNYGNDDLERTYTGLHLNARYRPIERLDLALAYAYSELEGNINGETQASGPVPSTPQDYPEFKQFPQWNPVGRLGADQAHKARAWAIYTLLDGERQRLSVSWLQRLNSGTPYGAAGAVRSSRFLSVPGYRTPPTQVAYFFTERDAFETEDVTQSDIAFNYSFRINDRFEIFLQPEILNLFDEDGVLNVDTTVIDATTGGSGLPNFNPFTTTPVEGVHWRKGPNFGQPLGETDLQDPRTFRFSVGLRF